MTVTAGGTSMALGAAHGTLPAFKAAPATSAPRIRPGGGSVDPSEQRAFSINKNMQSQAGGKPEDQHNAEEGRCYMVPSWKVIHVTFLCIETDLV